MLKRYLPGLSFWLALLVIFSIVMTWRWLIIRDNELGVKIGTAADKRKAEVAQFRTMFMNDCLDAGRRPHECIVMWSAVKIDDWR